jgi:superfamily II RNA helicase
LSAFVCDDEAQTKIDLPPDLTERLEEMERIRSRIIEAAKECRVEIGMEQWDHKIEATYVTVTHNSAGGAGLKSLIEENPGIFERSVIRHQRRTEDILRQAARAAKEMGETAMEVAILERIALIKRDIIFEDSLYV